MKSLEIRFKPRGALRGASLTSYEIINEYLKTNELFLTSCVLEQRHTEVKSCFSLTICFIFKITALQSVMHAGKSLGSYLSTIHLFKFVGRDSECSIISGCQLYSELLCFCFVHYVLVILISQEHFQF